MPERELEGGPLLPSAGLSRLRIRHPGHEPVRDHRPGPRLGARLRLGCAGRQSRHRQPDRCAVKALGSHIVETVVATRGANGWQEVESLAPPNVETTGEYTGPLHSAISVSPDFTESVVITDQPIAGPDRLLGRALPAQSGRLLHPADAEKRRRVRLLQRQCGLTGLQAHLLRTVHQTVRKRPLPRLPLRRQRLRVGPWRPEAGRNCRTANWPPKVRPCRR